MFISHSRQILILVLIAFRSLSRKLKVVTRFLRSFHHRHVYTCLCIFILLIFYITLLWHFTARSTWLFAITAFSLELIVRLTASLAQYTLYVLDAHGLLSNADSFDEYIFRVKAVTSCFEFILGVFLLFNGFYILFYEARGALRAFMLAIHAHLNIVKNFRRGLQILRNRRSAWDNVNQLPLATEQQIENCNDICAICHNELTVGNTCVTPCAHLFHKKCLQKVFYATQNCALCSRPIIIERNGRLSPAPDLQHRHQE
jgi:E3 ubiquitin-protein ligase RNF139